MEVAPIRRPFGWARLVIGASMVVAPGAIGRLWWDRDVAPNAAAMLRGLGARDAAIGAGTALVGPRQAHAWVRAGIVADSADALAALLGGDLPASKRAITVAFAASGAVAGVLLDRSLP